MGLANLVPGVSGGTLILAVGIYDRFVGSIARISRLKFERSDLVFIGTLGLGAVFAVLCLVTDATMASASNTTRRRLETARGALDSASRKKAK